MDTSTRRFMELMRHELEDVRHDAEHLLRNCEERHQRGEISEYVHRENAAICANIVRAVECMEHTLDAADPDAYAGVGDLLDALKRRCEGRLKEMGVHGGLERVLERKMEKVARLLAMKPAAPET